MSGSISGGNVIGSGSDSIVLNMSEDQSQGQDAQFTVNVDGEQIGGVQTVTASHSAGQDETFTFLGNYAPGQHNVTVTFVNNFQYPGTSGDRNLYVDRVSYDGQTVSSSTTPIYQSPLFPPNSTQGDISGNAVFGVNDTTSAPQGSGSSSTTTPGPVSVGSGSDTIVLNMAEDPYQGDAQFTVSVDGKQIGGTQTTTAVVSQGQQQEFDVHGDFGGGTHTVTVDYLNDNVGGYYPSGTPLASNADPSQQWALDTADRNLYVMSVSMNGGPSDSKAPWELSSSGSTDFSVTSGSNQNAGSSQASSSQGSSGTTDTSSSTATTGTSSSTGGTTDTSSSTGGTTGTSSSTSDTATVSSDTLNAGQASNGSSSGMSFVSPTTDTSASSSSGTNTSSGSSGGSGTTTTDTTSSGIAASSGSGTSTQDFTVPVSSSTGTTDTSNNAGGGGSWQQWQQNNNWHGWSHQAG